MLRSIMLTAAALTYLPASAQDAAEGTSQRPELTDVESAASIEPEVQVGERVPPDSPDMTRPAQSDASAAEIMAQRLGMGGPLNLESNWSRFDTDEDGMLSPLEFGMWVMETNGRDVSETIDADLRSRSSGNAAVEVLNATAGALSQVDTNRDWRVSREELSLVAE